MMKNYINAHSLIRESVLELIGDNIEEMRGKLYELSVMIKVQGNDDISMAALRLVQAGDFKECFENENER